MLPQYNDSDKTGEFLASAFKNTYVSWTNEYENRKKFYNVKPDKFDIIPHESNHFISSTPVVQGNRVLSTNVPISDIIELKISEQNLDSAYDLCDCSDLRKSSDNNVNSFPLVMCKGFKEIIWNSMNCNNHGNYRNCAVMNGTIKLNDLNPTVAEKSVNLFKSSYMNKKSPTEIMSHEEFCSLWLEKSIKKLNFTSDKLFYGSYLRNCSLRALKDEKKMVKNALRCFDSQFSKFFRRPVEHKDKERIRILYLYYTKIKKLLCRLQNLPSTVDPLIELDKTSDSIKNFDLFEKKDSQGDLSALPNQSFPLSSLTSNNDGDQFNSIDSSLDLYGSSDSLFGDFVKKNKDMPSRNDILLKNNNFHLSLSSFGNDKLDYSDTDYIDEGEKYEQDQHSSQHKGPMLHDSSQKCVLRDVVPLVDGGMMLGCVSVDGISCNNVSLENDLNCLAELRRVKYLLKQKLKTYQVDFIEKHGRAVKFHKDIEPVQNEYSEYKKVKEQFKVLNNKVKSKKNHDHDVMYLSDSSVLHEI